MILMPRPQYTVIVNGEAKVTGLTSEESAERAAHPFIASGHVVRIAAKVVVA